MSTSTHAVDESSSFDSAVPNLTKIIRHSPRFDTFEENQREFFKSFSSFRNFETCGIEAFKFEEGKMGVFVSYIVHVKTRDVDYMLSRRYSEFYELHNEILKNHKEIVICNFPEKKWFGNLEETVIKERMIKLNAVYEFFEYDLKSFSFDKIKIHASNKDDELLLDLLIKLNLNESSLSKVFEEFEFILFEKKSLVLNKLVEILLLGDQDLKGLLEICGKVDETCAHFTCYSGLKFLCSLMNHEKNPGADAFHKVFTNCHLKQLGQLNLASHIIGNPSKRCKKYALMLLKIYLDGNPNVGSYLIETLLESPEAFKEFVKWKQSQNIFSQKTEGFHVSYESEGVLNPRASLIFEEINFFSATMKKIRSPLLRKRTTSILKNAKSSNFKKGHLSELEFGKKS